VFVCGTYIFSIIIIPRRLSDVTITFVRQVRNFFLRKLRGDPRPIWYNRTNYYLYKYNSVYIQHGYRRQVSTLLGWKQCESSSVRGSRFKKEKTSLHYIIHWWRKTWYTTRGYHHGTADFFRVDWNSRALLVGEDIKGHVVILNTIR